MGTEQPPHIIQIKHPVQAADLDRRLHQIYNYYMKDGFVPLALKVILDILSFVFTSLLLVFLLYRVDWPSIARCAITNTCGSSLTRSDLPWIVIAFTFPIVGPVCVGYLGFLFYQAGSTLRGALWVRGLLLELAIDEDDIPTMPWETIVDRLMMSNFLERYYVTAEGEQRSVPLTEREVTARLCRVDNFVISLVDRAVLPLSKPSIWALWHKFIHKSSKPTPPSTVSHDYSDLTEVDRTHAADTHGATDSVLLRTSRDPDPLPVDSVFGVTVTKVSSRPNVFFPRVLESMLRITVFSKMFGTRNIGAGFAAPVVQGLFVENPRAAAKWLAWRFRISGIIFAVAAPYIFVYVIIFSLLGHGTTVYANPAFLSSGKWTQYALWRLRAYNELPHVFSDRIKRSYKFADQYVSKFRKPASDHIFRFIVYIISGMLAVLLGLTLIDDSIASSTTILNRTLLWYTGVLSVVVLSLRSMISSSGFGTPKEALDRVTGVIGFKPRQWIGREHSRAVLIQFRRLYSTWLGTLLDELLAIAMIPIVFIVTLPRTSETIVRWMVDHERRVEDPPIGAIYRFDTPADLVTQSPAVPVPEVPESPVLGIGVDEAEL